MLDIFKNDAFSLTSLTEAFVKAPYVPGRIGQLNLFQSRGISTTSAVIEYKDGRVGLLQTSPRGGEKVNVRPSKDEKRNAVSVLVPHIEANATILADEVQGVRAFGTEDATEAVQALVNERLAELRQDIEVTIEYQRAHAIQGIVKDADGSTLLNLFTALNVSQSTGTVTPDTAADDFGALRREIRAIQRTIENVLGAAPIAGYHAFCGKDFFDALRADAGVEQTLRYADPSSLLNQATSFTYGGVTWEEYRGSTGGTPFFANGEAYVFPLGPSIFRTYFAPADFNDTVNTLGLPAYARLFADPELNRWTKVHAQSNPLVLCTRPDAIVKVTYTT